MRTPVVVLAAAAMCTSATLTARAQDLVRIERTSPVTYRIAGSLISGVEHSVVADLNGDGELEAVVTRGCCEVELWTLTPVPAQLQTVTLPVHGILDLEAHRMRYVTAGHPDPILIREGRAVNIDPQPGFPIGMVDMDKYEESTLELQPGDRLYLFSDGVYEELNTDREQYGRKRIVSTLERNHSRSLADSLDALVQEVAAWRGDESFTDDISILAAERFEL